jgi:hypothetical protein
MSQPQPTRVQRYNSNYRPVGQSTQWKGGNQDGPTNTNQLPAYLEEPTTPGNTISPTERTNPGPKSDIQADAQSYQQDLRRSQRQSNQMSPMHTMVEHTDPSAELEFPHGEKEGVGIAPSRIPGTGKELFGTRPDQDSPLLIFKKARQFMCIYATAKEKISDRKASTFTSAYIWCDSRNTTEGTDTNKRNTTENV